MDDQLASVYCLKDNRNNEIFYVGMSIDPHSRYGEHLITRGKAKITDKSIRILEMRKNGVLPELLILERGIEPTNAIEREKYWIQYYLDLGTPLTNKPKKGIDMPEGEKRQKQKGIDAASYVIIVDEKEYVTCEGAARVLTELVGGERTYSRYTVYRMLTDYHVDVIRTPSANYYSVQGLRELKDKLHPKVGKKKGSTHYTAEKKEQAMQLRSQGLSNREIGRSLGISYQTINNWAKGN